MTTSIDEQGNASIEYKDNEGKTLQKAIEKAPVITFAPIIYTTHTTASLILFSPKAMLHRKVL
jgi:hypothetical protein